MHRRCCCVGVAGVAVAVVHHSGGSCLIDQIGQRSVAATVSLRLGRRHNHRLREKQLNEAINLLNNSKIEMNLPEQIRNWVPAAVHRPWVAAG